jgi:hypothetical protein
MRYYEARYPEVDELVMVQVRQIAEMGAYVKLVRPIHFYKTPSARFAFTDVTRLCSSNMTISRA